MLHIYIYDISRLRVKPLLRRPDELHSLQGLLTNAKKLIFLYRYKDQKKIATTETSGLWKLRLSENLTKSLYIVLVGRVA